MFKTCITYNISHYQPQSYDAPLHRVCKHVLFVVLVLFILLVSIDMMMFTYIRCHHYTSDDEDIFNSQHNNQLHHLLARGRLREQYTIRYIVTRFENEIMVAPVMPHPARYLDVLFTKAD